MHAHVSVHVSVHAWGGVFAQRDMLCVPAYVYVCVYPLTSNITTSILYCNTETSWLEGYFEE